MKRNILIVDDHKGIQLLLLEVFTHQGYNVTIAQTGIEALGLLEDQVYDVAIIDNNLPIISGVELVRRLSQQDVSFKVIMVSGMTNHLREEMKDYPIVKKVLEKPFNITDLCAIVKGAMED